VEPVPGDVDGHVGGVPQPVHVADLVAVVRGDGHLADRLARLVELQDDLGVEVEPVAALERDLGSASTR
jgi:hypothetical protein